MTPASRRIGFLLNHEGTHQAAHAVPVALALARLCPDWRVDLLVTGQALAGEAQRLVGPDGLPANMALTTLPGLRMAGAAEAAIGGALPVRRLGALWRHRRHLCGYDALAVPEKTTLLLRRFAPRRCPLLIHTRHGAGDRAVGFDRATAGFDFHLLPGAKHERRMQAQGLIRPGRYALVGYPKFDALPDGPPPRLFDNDRPTVLYAPHFDPALSSWYRWGPDILRLFAHREDVNLIFAPHVMLFARRRQLTPRRLRPVRVPPVPDDTRGLKHVLIDTGSPRSTDMTYTRAADIWLGDVSSQIYEFLHRPRPAVFLDATGAGDPDDPDWRFLSAGPVLRDIDGLGDALEAARAEPDRYRAAQDALLADTFAPAEGRASLRAARAIRDFLETGTVTPM